MCLVVSVGDPMSHNCILKVTHVGNVKFTTVTNMSAAV